MKTIKLIFLFSIFTFLFFNSCKQAPKEDAYDKAIKAEDDLMNTKEFNDYFNLFFQLSNKNTKTDLPYVNKFMSENRLWKFKDICDLLNNEKIKNNQRIYDYWKVRCEFQNAKNILMEKYGLDKDSLKIVMEHAISTKSITPESNNK